MGRSVTLLLLLTGLAGCATAPRYQNYAGQDAACIKGDTANFVKFFAEGEAHVQIKEIDGVPTGSGEPYCFPPGKRRLGVSGYNNLQTAQDYVDLDFEAGRKYWLRANLRGISFVFQLLDVTGESERKVAQFTLKVSFVTQPVPVPIFVPTR